MPHQTIIPPSAEIVTPESYSGVWRRFIAWCIDRTIINLSLFLLSVPLLFMTSVAGMMMFPMVLPMSGLVGIGLGGVWLFADWLYFAAFESSSRGATIGKKWMGVRVTDADGNRLSFGRASLRYFSKILSALPMMLGFVMAFFTEKKQALHDLIAGTIVVRTK